MGDLDVTSSISIEGRGAAVDANGIDRVFHVSSGAWLRVHDLTIIGGVGTGRRLPPTRAAVCSTPVSSSSTQRGQGQHRDPCGRWHRCQCQLDHDRAAVHAVGHAMGPGPGNGGGLHLTGVGEVTVDRSRSSVTPQPRRATGEPDDRETVMSGSAGGRAERRPCWLIRSWGHFVVVRRVASVLAPLGFMIARRSVLPCPRPWECAC